MFLQIVDQMLIATPVRLVNLWTTEVFAVVYVCFNIAWFFFGPAEERVIYPILDWGNNPVEAIIVVLVACFVLEPLCALLHYGVFR